MDYYSRRQEIAAEIWRVIDAAGGTTSKSKVEVLISHVVAKYGCSEKFVRGLVEANVKSGHLRVMQDEKNDD